jgi:hypothetical protein
MFFSGLGADAYRALLRDLHFDALVVEEAMIEEPDGPAWFLWVLVRSSRGRPSG